MNLLGFSEDKPEFIVWQPSQSPPSRRESAAAQEDWIPACAGMTSKPPVSFTRHQFELADGTFLPAQGTY